MGSVTVWVVSLCDRCHCVQGIAAWSVSLCGWGQDDRLYPLLTVRETLEFSARLRLPGSLSRAEKRARVEDLLAQLGLEACAGTRIGDGSVSDTTAPPETLHTPLQTF